MMTEIEREKEICICQLLGVSLPIRWSMVNAVGFDDFFGVMIEVDTGENDGRVRGGIKGI